MRMPKSRRSRLKYDLPLPMNLAILLPAYNEERTVRETIAEFSSVCPNAYFVVIDNNSSDDTFKVASTALQELGLHGRIIQERRRGKAIAIRSALLACSADVYVMVDSDTTYDASDLGRLIDPVIRDEADLVIGDRISSRDYARQNTRPFHIFGNRLVTGLINRLYGANLKDVMSGYRVFNRRVATSIPLLYNGFELETEMTVFALDRRLRLAEIPVRYRPRPKNSSSKLRTTADGMRVLKLIFILFKDFKPLVFFSVCAGMFFLLGLGAGLLPVLEYLREGYVYRVPLAILAVGLMLFSLVMLSTGLILDTVVNADKRNYEIMLRQESGFRRLLGLRSSSVAPQENGINQELHASIEAENGH